MTGASGFVGHHVTGRLAAVGDEVHAVSHASPPPGPGVRSHTVDLLRADAGAQLVATVRPTHLLHLAWVSTSGAYSSSPDNAAWVEASLELLRAFIAHGGSRVVMAGSCAEYDWSRGWCREDVTPLRPATLYGASKAALWAAAEPLARRAGVSAAWARLFFMYGPHEPPDRLVSSVIRGLLRSTPVACTGGTQARDFIYVEDVAEALVRLLGSRWTGAVNVGSGEPVAVRTIVERIGGLTGRSELIRLGARPGGDDEAALVAADVGRIRDEVGWAPRHDLQTGLARTVDWWRCRAAAGDAVDA